MPGAADAVADHEPIGERPVVVAAMGADGEHLGAAAHQQHLLIADMPDELAVDELLGVTPCAKSGVSGVPPLAMFASVLWQWPDCTAPAAECDAIFTTAAVGPKSSLRFVRAAPVLIRRKTPLSKSQWRSGKVPGARVGSSGSCRPGGGVAWTPSLRRRAFLD